MQSIHIQRMQQQMGGIRGHRTQTVGEDQKECNAENEEEGYAGDMVEFEYLYEAV